MPDIKLQIVNAALTTAGEDPLDASLTPGTVLANAAISNYDAIVSEELENGTWKFATHVCTPTLLTKRAEHPLKYQWQRAAEDVEVQAVLFRGRPLEGEDYEIQGRVVRTRVECDVKIKYTYRPDESLWPQRFCRIITQRLEALFLRVTERFSEATQRDQDTTIKTMIARNTEARQRRNRPLGPGTVVDARMGRRPRRFF